MPTRLDAITSLLDLGSADQAIDMIRAYWQPDLAPALRCTLYALWIRALCEVDSLDMAVRLAQRANEEFPRDLEILAAYGNSLDLRGEITAAQRVFQSAVDLDPTCQLSRYNLAAICDRQGDEKAAEAHFRAALVTEAEIMPMPEAVSALAAMLRRQGRAKEAEEIYDSYLEKDPLDVELLIEHGVCLSDLDRHDEALAALRSAITLDPTHAIAWYYRAIALYRGGSFAEAIAAMEHSIALDPQAILPRAVMGSWLLADRDADIDRGLQLVYQACEEVEEELNLGSSIHGWIVYEEVFEALWSTGRRNEARLVAMRALLRDAISTHVLQTLHRENQPPIADGEAFLVDATYLFTPGDDESASPSSAGGHGFQLDLVVVARSAAQAIEMAHDHLELCSAGRPGEAQINVGPHTMSHDPDLSLEVPGVARVLGPRQPIAYVLQRTPHNKPDPLT